MAKIQSWEVSDAFWEKIEPLIPAVERDPDRTYKRKAGGGRKADTPPEDFRSYCVCSAHRVPVEGLLLQKIKGGSAK